MKNPFRALLARKSSTPPSKSFDAPSTLQAGSEAANRQQLVLITMRDLLRRSAIPAHWLECQTLLVTSRSRGAGLYIHLVVHHWDERLLRYTQAFQAELKERILRFDPKAASWVHGIAWDFGALPTSPFPVLPPKSTWDADQAAGADQLGASPGGLATAAPLANFPVIVPTSPGAPTKSAISTEVAQDLAKLFAIRDRELAPGAQSNDSADNSTDKSADNTRRAVPFDPTEPAPLR